MRRTYNQYLTKLNINGVDIVDFFEGSTIVFTWDGGEVGKTQGTDGASINLATKQGATISFTVRESSFSRQFLHELRNAQYNGGPGATVVFNTGVGIIENLLSAFISNPGTLQTGDKMMGGITYTLTSANHESLNMNPDEWQMG